MTWFLTVFHGGWASVLPSIKLLQMLNLNKIKITHLVITFSIVPTKLRLSHLIFINFTLGRFCHVVKQQHHGHVVHTIVSPEWMLVFLTNCVHCAFYVYHILNTHLLQHHSHLVPCLFTLLPDARFWPSVKCQRTVTPFSSIVNLAQFGLNPLTPTVAIWVQL